MKKHKAAKVGDQVKMPFDEIGIIQRIKEKTFWQDQIWVKVIAPTMSKIGDIADFKASQLKLIPDNKKLLPIQVRVKLEGTYKTRDLVAYVEADTIKEKDAYDDAVSDYLYLLDIKYRWFRITEEIKGLK